LPEHSVITDPNIHEPKGVATAAAGEVYVANGSGSGAWDPRLPSQSGNSGKVLKTDGSAESWDYPYFSAGLVSSGGTLSAGVNCTVTRPSTGIYEVLFDTAAPSADYRVMVTSETSGAARTVAAYSRATTGFTVETRNVGSSPTVSNGAFSFIVFL